MSAADMVDFALDFMVTHKVPIMQINLLSGRVQSLKNSADVEKWMVRARSGMGFKLYKQFREEFRDHIKKDVGFIPITQEGLRERLKIFEDILSV